MSSLGSDIQDEQRFYVCICRTFGRSSRHRLRQRLLAEGIQELAHQVGVSATQEQKRRIAIVGFRELDGRSTVLGSYLAEALTTQLFRSRRFEIVERTLLDKLMQEMKLGSIGVLDASTAARLGKVAGVDAIVTGTVTDMQSSVSVNSRIIDVTTGMVFGAAEVRIVKDDDLRAIMGKTIVPSMPAASTSENAPSARATVQGVDFEVDRCGRRGTAVSCRLWVTNTRSDTSFFIGSGVGVVGASFWDDQGNQFRSTRILVGNQVLNPLGVRLISGVRTPAIFEIEGTITAKTFSRIAFSASTSEAGFFTVTFNHVPIQ